MEGVLADKSRTLLLEALDRWQRGNALGDCPLPVLYRSIKAESPWMTIGRFHDSLRGLHENRRVHLHPWTGPLHELPEPTYALLVGHEVAYYASVDRLD